MEVSPTAASHPCSILAVSAEGSQACAKGCELCSEVNGCLKCSPKLFILLERNDIRQVGVCLPSCPPGYFDARNPDMNKCINSPAVIAAPGPCPALCEWAWLGGHRDQGRRPSTAEPEAPNLALSSECKIEHCEACFSHNFCTKCKENLYLHKGRCYPACPEGSAAANGTMECSNPGKAGRRGRQMLRPRVQDPGGGAGWGDPARESTKDASSLGLRLRADERGSPGVPRARGGDVTRFSSCFPPLLPAQCEMSEWSLWGPCSKKKKLCGFRRGSEERTRRVLNAPGGDHTVCSDTKETRRCTGRRTPCPEGQKRRKGSQGRRENANRNPGRKENKEAGAGARRRKDQRQRQQQGTAGPVTSAGST
eukprot:bmy_02123T0